MDDLVRVLCYPTAPPETKEFFEFRDFLVKLASDSRSTLDSPRAFFSKHGTELTPGEDALRELHEMHEADDALQTLIRARRVFLGETTDDDDVSLFRNALVIHRNFSAMQKRQGK